MSSGRKLLYWSLVLFITILLLLYSRTLRSFISSGLQAVGIPIWRVENYIFNSQTGFFAYMRSKHTLALENQDLKEKNEKLLAANLRTGLLEDENEILKNNLGRSNQEKRILASVLVHPSKSLFDSVIIDIGSDHGVAIGDYVSGNDIYLGKVTEVYTHSSKAVLFSSSGEHTEVLLNPSHISVTAYGRGGGNFYAEVPRGVDLAVGDVVTIPTIGVDIFATIEDIVEKPSDSYRTVLFKNPVNIETLRFVEVVKS